MTKRDFVIFAEEIRNLLDAQQRLNAATAVAVACVRINPRFDAQKFYVACGITPAEIRDDLLCQVCGTAR
jgi:hypothetical protein